MQKGCRQRCYSDTGDSAQVLKHDGRGEDVLGDLGPPHPLWRTAGKAATRRLQLSGRAVHCGSGDLASTFL